MSESRFRRRRPGIPAVGGSAETHYATEARFVRMRVRATHGDDLLIGRWPSMIRREDGEGSD